MRLLGLPNGSEIGGGSGPVFTPLAACDISSVCRGFMQAHCNSPAHIFEDLFARLSKKAQDDIALSEKLTADTLVDMKNKDKEVLQLYGDNLLSEYMSTLSRSGSLLSRAKCQGLMKFMQNVNIPPLTQFHKTRTQSPCHTGTSEFFD